MSAIRALRGRQILDSRGRPTVEAEIELADGTQARASVPSGASTGAHEAVELRDGADAWGGLGVETAAANVGGELLDAVRGIDAADQAAVDTALIERDGEPDKSRLGANAILAVSLVTARAAATSAGMPLWQWLARDRFAPAMPVPEVNLISGGAHARQGLAFQDFLVVPLRATRIADALRICVAIRDSLAGLLAKRGASTLKADEGGFGPVLEGGEAEALELVVAAIEQVGLEPGIDVAIALDVAASEFFDPGAGYELGGEALSAPELVDRLVEHVDRWPVVSIEDGLAENDWEGWLALTERLGRRVELVGDDLFTTNPDRLRRGIGGNIANSVLVKMNQIGTLSETFETVRVARAAGYGTVISARSGETEDDALADLAVALGGQKIKVGSVAQSERLAKYNRLLRIADELEAVDIDPALRDAVRTGAPR